MTQNAILETVRKTKEKLSAKFNYDFEAMVRDAQRRQRRSGQKLVSVKPRRRAKANTPS
jgi:hypothetical protein